jgi:hypothetical protein
MMWGIRPIVAARRKTMKNAGFALALYVLTAALGMAQVSDRSVRVK